jgi:hypothetical protein
MDMVERVAKAIAFADGAYENMPPKDRDALWTEHWEWYLRGRGKGGAADHSNQSVWARQATAAIAAMREPTSVMLDAAAAIDENQIVRDNPGGAWDATQTALWAAMIDAALSEN